MERQEVALVSATVDEGGCVLVKSSVRHPILEGRVFGLTLDEPDCSLRRHRKRPRRLMVVDTRWRPIGAQLTFCVLHIPRDVLVKPAVQSGLPLDVVKQTNRLRT